MASPNPSEGRPSGAEETPSTPIPSTKRGPSTASEAEDSQFREDDVNVENSDEPSTPVPGSKSSSAAPPLFPTPLTPITRRSRAMSVGIGALTPANDSARDSEPATPVRRGRSRKSELPPTPSNSALNTSQSDSVSRATNTTLTFANLNQWRKVDLVEECRRRGLSYQGRKAEMRDRILDSLSPAERPSVPIAADDSGVRRLRSDKLSFATSKTSKGLAVQTSTQSGPTTTTRNLRRATTAGVETGITVDDSNPFPPSPGFKSFARRRLRSSSGVSQKETLDDISKNLDSTDNNDSSLRLASTEKATTNQHDEDRKDSNRSRKNIFPSLSERATTVDRTSVEHSDDELVDKSVDHTAKGQGTLTEEELGDDQNNQASIAENVDAIEESAETCKSRVVEFAIKSISKDTKVQRFPPENMDAGFDTGRNNTHDNNSGLAGEEISSLPREPLSQEVPEGSDNDRRTEPSNAKQDRKNGDEVSSVEVKSQPEVLPTKSDVRVVLKTAEVEASKYTCSGKDGDLFTNTVAKVTSSKQIESVPDPKRSSDETQDQERPENLATAIPRNTETDENSTENQMTSGPKEPDTFDRIEDGHEDARGITESRDSGVALNDNPESLPGAMAVVAHLVESSVQTVDVNNGGNFVVQVHSETTVCNAANPSGMLLSDDGSLHDTTDTVSNDVKEPGLGVPEGSALVDPAPEKTQVEKTYGSGDFQSPIKTDQNAKADVVSSDRVAPKVSAVSGLGFKSSETATMADAYASTELPTSFVEGSGDPIMNRPSLENNDDSNMPTTSKFSKSQAPETECAGSGDVEMVDAEEENIARSLEVEDVRQENGLLLEREKGAASRSMVPVSVAEDSLDDATISKGNPILGNLSASEETPKRAGRDEDVIDCETTNDLVKGREEGCSHGFGLSGKPISMSERKHFSGDALNREASSQTVEDVGAVAKPDCDTTEPVVKLSHLPGGGHDLTDVLMSDGPSGLDSPSHHDVNVIKTSEAEKIVNETECQSVSKPNLFNNLDHLRNNDTTATTNYDEPNPEFVLDEGSYFSESPLPSPRAMSSANLNETGKDELAMSPRVPQSWEKSKQVPSGGEGDEVFDSVQGENYKSVVRGSNLHTELFQKRTKTAVSEGIEENEDVEETEENKDLVGNKEIEENENNEEIEPNKESEGSDVNEVVRDIVEIEVDEDFLANEEFEVNGRNELLDGNEHNDTADQDNVMTEEDMDENPEAEIETMEEDQFDSNSAIPEINSSVLVTNLQASDEDDVCESGSSAGVDNPSDDGAGEIDIGSEGARDEENDEESKSSEDSAGNESVEPDESVEEERASDDSLEVESEEEDLNNLEEQQHSLGGEDVISLSSADDGQEQNAILASDDEESAFDNQEFEDNDANVEMDVVGDGDMSDENVASSDRDGEEADVEDEVDVVSDAHIMMPEAEIAVIDREADRSLVVPVANTKTGESADDSLAPADSQSGIIAFAGKESQPFVEVNGDVDTSEPVPLSPMAMPDPAQNRPTLAQSRYKPYVRSYNQEEASSVLQQTQKALNQLGEEITKPENVENLEHDRHTRDEATRSVAVCGSGGTMSQSSAPHNDLFAPAPPPSPLFQGSLESNLNTAGLGCNPGMESQKVADVACTGSGGAVIAMGGEAGIAIKRKKEVIDRFQMYHNNVEDSNVGKSLDGIATISTLGSKRAREADSADAIGNVALQGMKNSQLGGEKCITGTDERPAKRIKRASGMVQKLSIVPTPADALRRLNPHLYNTDGNGCGTQNPTSEAECARRAEILRRLGNIVEKEQGRKFEAFKEPRPIDVSRSNGEKGALFCIGTTSRNDNLRSRRNLMNRFKKVKVVQLNDSSTRQKLVEESLNRVREAVRTSKVDETLRNTWESRNKG